MNTIQMAAKFYECRDAYAQLQEQRNEFLALLRRIEPYIDGIVCYASTMGEHEPNRLAVDLRNAIAAAAEAT